MARDGEILNKGILQRMAEYLNLGGVKRSPGFLNMDDVKAVYVVGSEFMPVYSLGKSWPHTLSLAGGTSSTFDITGTTETGASDQLFKNGGYPCDLVGLEVIIRYDAAGALADNGVVMSLALTRWQRYLSLDPNTVMRLENWQLVTTGTLNYIFNLGAYSPRIAAGAFGPVVYPSFQSIHIPQGDRFSVLISRLNGGVWPANTTIDMTAHILTPVPPVQQAFAFST